MSLLDNAAIRLVESTGRKVIDPSNPADLAGIVPFLAQQGYRVFPPLVAPEVGSAWARTRGVEVVREVVAAANGLVTYRVRGSDEARPPVTVRAWHDWRGQAKAKQVTP